MQCSVYCLNIIVIVDYTYRALLLMLEAQRSTNLLTTRAAGLKKEPVEAKTKSEFKHLEKES